MEIGMICIDFKRHICYTVCSLGYLTRKNAIYSPRKDAFASESGNR